MVDNEPKQMTPSQRRCADQLSDDIREAMSRFLGCKAFEGEDPQKVCGLSAYVLISYAWRYAAIAKLNDNGVPDPELFAAAAKHAAESNPIGEMLMKYVVKEVGTSKKSQWTLVE